MKIKSVFFKNEIFYLLAIENSSFERMCYDYDVIIDGSGDHDTVIDYEAMIIDKSEGIMNISILTEDFSVKKIVDMNSVEKYVKIIASDNNAIYYRKDDDYYLYDKNDKSYRQDNKPPEDKVDYCSEPDLDDEYYIDAMAERDYYESLTGEEAWDLGEETYDSWNEWNNLNSKIVSKTVSLASGESCKKIELLNYSESTYKINDTQYLSIFGKYIFIIYSENTKLNKEYPFVENHTKQYFNQKKNNEIYLIDEQSYILRKEKKIQIFTKDTLQYSCDLEIDSFYIYDTILVILLLDKKTIFKIDISNINSIQVQSIPLSSIENMKWEEKDIVNKVIITTTGKIGIEYSHYVHCIEEGLQQISEDEFEPYAIDRSHSEKRICIIEELAKGYCLVKDIYFAYEDDDRETIDILFAIDDSRHESLVYSIYENEKGASFELNNKSAHDIEENGTKFNFEWNTFYAKKRLIISENYNDLKIYDQCPFASITIEKHYVFFKNKNNSIYYIGDIRELKFFSDKVAVFDGSNINILQLKTQTK